MTAYRRKLSCETTMLMLVEDWKLAVDRKEHGIRTSFNPLPLIQGIRMQITRVMLWLSMTTRSIKRNI